MPIRKTIFAPEEYYHLCNRGNRKQDIFLDDYDRARFLFLLLYGQSEKEILNAGRHAAAFVKNKKFSVYEKIIDQIVFGRIVRLNSFTLMGNHFHITAQETKDGGMNHPAASRSLIPLRSISAGYLGASLWNLGKPTVSQTLP